MSDTPRTPDTTIATAAVSLAALAAIAWAGAAVAALAAGATPPPLNGASLAAAAHALPATLADPAAAWWQIGRAHV